MNLNRKSLEVGARSETGYVREENQDRMSGTNVPLGHLYIVADGMGGHKGGALAAELAVQELQRQFSTAAANEPVDQVMQTAFKKANETIYEKSHSGDAAIEGMGTTAVVLLISGKVASLAHVGDSRAYLYRDGVLTQMTRDHTMVQKMVQAGMLKPEDAADHPNASVLERAVGTHPTVEVDISKELPIVDGDAFLLCSDGLCGFVRDEEIQSVLRFSSTAQETAAQLVALALQKGGKDNVTVQFVQYGPRKEQPRVEAAKPAQPAAAVAGTRNTAPFPESTKTDESANKTVLTSKSHHYSFYMVAAIALAAVLTALVFYLFLDRKVAGPESSSNSELKTNPQSASKTQQELEQGANQKKAKEEDDPKRQRAAEKESASKATKLSEELKKSESARETAEAEVGRVKSELRKADIARKNAEANAEQLKRQLEKERALKAAKASKPEEALKTTRTDGSTASKENSVTGNTNAQPEPTEPKKDLP